MIWIRLSQTDQPVAVGPKVGPPGPSEDLWGPQKGLSGPKQALLGAPGVLLRSPKGPKHMVWMWPTQLDKQQPAPKRAGWKITFLLDIW